MNKHFEDARYYLKRAGEHAKEGIKEEIEPVERRFRKITGNDEAPKPSRLDKVREDLEGIEQRAEGEAKKAVSDARERIKQYREA